MKKETNSDKADTALTQSDDPAALPPSQSDESGASTNSHGGDIRISAFAGRYSNLNNFDQRTQVYEAAERAVERRADLLMLPGYSFGRALIKQQAIQDLADRTGLAILAETHIAENNEHTWLYRPRQEPRKLLEQLFAQSAGKDNTSENNQAVIAALDHQGGDRRIDMCGMHIGVLLCGESTIVRNPRHGDTVMRVPELVWPYSYDVLLNPAHSTMKRWGELKRTLAFLSKGEPSGRERTLIYATNRGHESDKGSRKAWGSTLAVYRNGEPIASGNPVSTHNDISWDCSDRDEWRMVTVDCSAD